MASRDNDPIMRQLGRIGIHSPAIVRAMKNVAEGYSPLDFYLPEPVTELELTPTEVPSPEVFPVSPLSPDVFDDLTELDMIGNNVLEALFVKVYPTQADQIPGIRAEYKGNFLAVVATIMQASGLDSSMLSQIISDSGEHS